ncbi:MAG: radical SAM protein, partial [Candidatus Eremiobacterota bacterium]
MMSKPQLLETYKSCNVVTYDNFFYGIPLFLGPINLQDRKAIQNNLYIFRSTSKDEIYKMIDYRSRFVKRIRMDITNNCNLRCIMCETYNTVEKKEQKYFNIDNFIKSITPDIIRNLNFIQLGNIAEPLIHPHFNKFLDHIRNYSEYCGIYILTNGTLLHKYYKIINDYKCTMVISVDSLNKETYEYIRSGSNFERIMENLRLIDTKRVNVSIDQAIMASNIDEYGDFIDYCRKNNFKFTCRSMILKDFRGIISKRLIDESLWFHRDKINSWKEKYLYKNFDGIVQSQMIKSITPVMKKEKCTAH